MELNPLANLLSTSLPQKAASNSLLGREGDPAASSSPLCSSSGSSSSPPSSSHSSLSSSLSSSAGKLRSNTVFRQLAAYILEQQRRSSDGNPSSSSPLSSSSSPPSSSPFSSSSSSSSSSSALRGKHGEKRDIDAYWEPTLCGGFSGENPKREDSTEDAAQSRVCHRQFGDDDDGVRVVLGDTAAEKRELGEREEKKNQQLRPSCSASETKVKLRPTLQPECAAAQAGGDAEEMRADEEEAEDEEDALDRELRQRLEKELEEGGDFYDSSADEEDEKWVAKHLRVGDRTTDAILCCPGCFTPVCYQCQRHEKFLFQYRAVSACNVVVDSAFVSPSNRVPAERPDARASSSPRPASRDGACEAGGDGGETAEEGKGDKGDKADRERGETGGEREKGQELSFVNHLREMVQDRSWERGGNKRGSTQKTDRKRGEEEEIFCEGLEGQSAHAVKCATCSATVALLDEAETFHFFHVLPGEA
ncbi:E2F-associated phosphoprotein [Toxoplasma gondii TgCatPRC2]|uniref:E2F-associated phosphoprotein n=1 Tax=Toxoplasma gondii TgCatPRC2 TaxID=1130821 RepID=A0A151HQL4_TOXGO|nr:E2F-associated phosphoprotein [Toxoplasma gondii TgCatPRC2]